MKYTEIRKNISEKTGYHELLVDEIISLYNDALLDGLIEDLSVQIRELGTIFLKPLPPREKSLNNVYSDWSFALSIKTKMSVRPFLRERIRSLPEEEKQKYLKKIKKDVSVD